MKNCDICNRPKENLEFHHLIPKQLHGKKHFINKFGKKYMRETGINICRDCHKQLHKFYDHKDLGLNFYSLEKILNEEKIQNWIKFISKRK